MSSMVERVARHMAARDGHNPSAVISAGAPYTVLGQTYTYNFDKVGVPLWQAYEPLARAAIEAMRDAGPTLRGRLLVWDSMEAGAKAGNMDLHRIVGNGAPDHYWRLMLGAALEADP